MKIGIITILKVNNYGAELQAYALQMYLKKLGHEAEIIDYLFYKNKEHHKTPRSKPVFRFGFMKRLAETFYPVLIRMKERGTSDTTARNTNFLKFHERNTSLSKTYCTIDDLYLADLDYDVYITGSDQVWNPGIYSSILPYFLDFAPEGKRRVAYAASFGVNTLSVEVKKVYRDLLAKYTAIGVRELTGVDLVRQLGLDAINVLDPTLLLTLEDWRRISCSVSGLPGKYLLVYELTPSSYLNYVATAVAGRLGLPIVRICKLASKEDGDSINIMDAGPSEFLSLIDGADFVVTNSFHGTAFSVNFHKDFLVIAPNRKDNNSRQRDLLNLLGLSDRILAENDPLPEKLTIDFEISDIRLNAERNKSHVFLTTAIDEQEYLPEIV